MSKWALVIKEEIHFRQQISFHTVVLCCWWFVVHFVMVHKDIGNHMVITCSLFLCSLVLNVSSSHEVIQEWQEMVIGKETGRNSGEIIQQFIPSYFIPNENFYKSYVESLQCFLHSLLHEDENLGILYICFLPFFFFSCHKGCWSSHHYVCILQPMYDYARTSFQ